MIKYLSLLSLRARLIIIIFISVVPALLLLLHTTSEQKRTGEAEMREESFHLVKLASNNIEQLMEGAHQVLSVLAELPATHNHDSAECNTYVTGIKERLSMYNNILAVTPGGDIFCSALPPKGQINVSDRLWFQHAVQTRQFSVGRYMIGRISGRPVVNAGFPVIDRTGQLRAIVSISVDLQWFNEQLRNLELRKGAAVFLIDREGTILAHYPDPENWIGRNMSGTGIVKSILTRKEGTLETTGLTGENRIFSFTPVRGTDDGMFICTGISSEVAFADVYKTLSNNLLGLFLITLIASTAAWFGGDYFIIRRMKKLVKATDELATGNLGARVDIRIPDEIGQLGAAFNKMATALERSITEQKQTANELRGSYSALMDEVTQRAFTEKELAKVNRALRTISRSNAALARATNVQDFLNEICRIIVEDGRYQMAWVGYPDQGDEKRVRPVACAGFEAGYLNEITVTWGDDQWSKGPTGTAIRTGRVTVANNMIDTPMFAPWREHAKKRGYASAIGLPLMADGRVLGAITVYAPEMDVFIEEENKLLKELADDVAFGIVSLKTREDHMIAEAELKRSHEQLHNLASHLQSIRDEERTRISRELHDELGQVLTALKMDLIWMSGRVPRDNHVVIEKIKSDSDLVDSTIQTLKRICMELRPAMLDHFGLGAAVQWQAKQFEKRSGIKCHVTLEPEEIDVDEDLVAALYGIFREALTNVRRHACAENVEVTLREEGDNVTLQISDDGVGIEEGQLAKPNSFGLLGMRERVYPWKGEVRISSDKGTTITVVVPKRN